MSIFKPVTLITGASSGIGAALARVFAENGHQVALVARREARLSAVADAIAKDRLPRPHVVVVDLSRSDAPARIAHELLVRGCEPGIVVNNAGFGLFGPATMLDRGDQIAMIDLNVRALTDLSLRWIESVGRHKGGILNVASVASFLPGPNMAVYCATKAYVLSFTQSLHTELKPQGIRVTALCPGPVKTEFGERAGLSGEEFPRQLFRAAERVAREGYAGFMAGRGLVVPGRANRLFVTLARFLPHEFLTRMIVSRQKGDGPAAAGWPRRPAKPS